MAPEAKRGLGRGKDVEGMVAYAVGHPTRVKILILLNEGTYSPAEISELIDEPLNKVSNHLRELAEAGSIEVAETRRATRGSFVQNFYRAIETPMFRDFTKLMPQEREITSALVIQSLIAEALAGLAEGKMRNDPDVALIWDWLHVDEQGRREVAEEQEASWDRLARIEEESINRVAISGEATVSYLTAVLGFERARKAPKAVGSESGDCHTKSD